MKLLYAYQNGTQSVKIYDDGTKIREYDETIPQVINFPESIDVKLTNYCNMGCRFCHESSTKRGRHCDHYNFINVLVNAKLPKGIELALGGGAAHLHPRFDDILEQLNSHGFMCNLTINQKHVLHAGKSIRSHIESGFLRGIGVSVDNYLSFKNDFKALVDYPNVVLHCIAGYHDFFSIQNILKTLHKPKLLILGYKTFGRGINFYNAHRAFVNNGLNEWKDGWKKLLDIATVSFDNLAIEQLDVQNSVPEYVWNRCYMGDDATHSMYIDAVEEMFAPTSRSYDRVSFLHKSLLEYFDSIKGGVK